MALTGFMLLKVSHKINEGSRVASMGYPDILASSKVVEQILGSKAYKVEYRKDSEAICKRHGMNQHLVPDAASLFKLMGAQLDVFDVINERGCEIIADMNYPLAEQHLQQYDVVMDVGTLEHCFNIAQAGMNMAGLLRENGCIFHENPFNWGNHGFYGLNPTWYYDFYTQNGFELEDCRLLPREGGSIDNLPFTERFSFVKGEANLYAVAKRKEIATLRYPVQTKYKRSLG